MAQRTTWIEATTLGDLLDRQAARTGADVVRLPGCAITYSALAAEADHVARGLLALGIGSGDNVGLMLPTGVSFLAALFGIAKLGAVPVPINLRFRHVELAHVVRQAQLRAMLVAGALPGAPDFGALLTEVFDDLAAQPATALRLAQAPALRHVVTLIGEGPPGFLSRATFDAGAATIAGAAVQDAQESVCVADVGIIMYTSGTTSHPKGAMLSHEALTRQAQALAETRYRLGPDDRMWTPLPLFHIGGTIALLATMYGGGTFCHPGHFTADVALDQLERERCTVAFVPFEPVWTPVLNHQRFPETDLSALRMIQCGGPPEAIRWAQERTPWAVCVPGTGMTEAASYTALGSADDPLEKRLTTHGRPLAGMQVRIVDPETGDDVTAGERGEVLFRGFARTLGYFREPELTAVAIDADGWFHSGDVGTLDADGYFTWVSRLKDMLKVGGENVAAAEIEDHLAKHPGVAVVQVVSVPDGRLTEVAAAFVEPAPGVEAPSEQELIRFCFGQIASFKVPRYVRFVDEWPMSGTKIRKFVLRDRMREELGAGAVTAPRVEELVR
jgi:fatty-acyl-CoA synthase